MQNGTRDLCPKSIVAGKTKKVTATPKKLKPKLKPLGGLGGREEGGMRTAE